MNDSRNRQGVEHIGVASVQDWLIEASTILELYCKHADTYFNDVAELEVIPENAFVIRGDFNKKDGKETEARDALKALLSLLKTEPKISSPLKNDKRPERELLKLEMHIKLGLWLSFYCIGCPQLLLWEEIVALSVRLNAYPGEAFFNKLVGDAYRAERVEYPKRKSKLFTPQPETQSALHYKNPSYKGLFSLAFTPIVLIPDEDLQDGPKAVTADDKDVALELIKLIDITSGGSNCDLLTIEDSLVTSFAEKYKNYIQWTTRLAHRYLRFQIWCYLRSNNDLSLHYAVSQASAISALVDLAQRRAGLKTLKNLSPEDRLKFEDTLFFYKKESNKRIKMFFGSSLESEKSRQLASRRVVVFEHETEQPLDSQRGLISCALASEDGVLASRPRREGEWEDCCFYVEGLPLAIEREKLKKLWEDFDGKYISENNSPVFGQRKIKGHECGNYADFANVWVTERIINELKAR